MSDLLRDKPNKMNDIEQQDHRRIAFLGSVLTILMIWNGVCDYIYGYSPNLSGFDYFTSKVIDVVSTANGRPHWLIMLGQTAGWLYPAYALTYYLWWRGMRKSGFWLGYIPNILLAYAILMIGGVQHAGWAFLSVLEQAKAVVGSTDSEFYSLANRYILEHFAMGDITAVLALYIGSIWHAIAILSGRTIFPRWFLVVSPLGVLIITFVIGLLLPAPLAGFVLALFGTWFMLIPNISSTIWLLNRKNYRTY
ncbi:hypothetical protein Pryu01_02628 [Paraliobacillus ryukyuensis]|uniref:DUF4386 family protein n=1 Tax=Paraliobacillus ryukyuensis TaxID=200904 RepID=A0A366E1I9_9BACI|nr:hypothetical protein [Paraliobacillus ryukyuensis]RBO95298.1 hypothetical protein DES48_1086 [Paraliobacillus ryukyuensis]